MTIHRWLLAGVFGAWFACCTAGAQQPPSAPLFPAPSPIPANGATEPIQAPAAPSVSGLSDWMLYNSNATAVKRDCCEGFDGKITPLFTELYVRVGPAVPVGGDTLTRELKTGWTIEIGGRELFFNEPMTKAWTIDLNIINTYESGGRQNTEFPLIAYSGGTKVTFGSGGTPGARVSASNRTEAGLGLGREWYLYGSANDEGCKWRVGIDMGGRWGSHKLDLSATVAPGHLTDVVASFYSAIHTDVEIPTRFGLFFTGLRAEWAYTWSDILVIPSNVQDLNLLVEVGLRF